jgi:uncharacterized delta-60 repeat protein
MWKQVAPTLRCIRETAMKLRSILCLATLAASAPAAADSEIDTDFGMFPTGHNVVPINNGGNDADMVADVLTAADGSLYLVGTSTNTEGQTRLTLVHLHANGQLDLDFGTDGRYIGPVGTGNVLAAAASFDANGDILVAGSKLGANGRDFTVCKFRGAGVTQFSALGTPCATFAFDLVPNGPDTARDLAVFPDGRIALVGSAGIDDDHHHAAIAVLNPDGTPHAAFGPGGKRHWLPDDLRQVLLQGVALQSGNILYAVGESAKNGSTERRAHAVRVSSTTGNVIASSDGQLGTSNGPAYYRDITIMPNGPGYAVGGVFDDGRTCGVLTRLLPGSDYDPDWTGGNGHAPLCAGEHVEFTRVARQSDGKFLVVGMLRDDNFTTASLFVARYNVNGSRDVGTFNILMGYREIDFQTPGVFDIGAALTLQGGRPVIAGSVQAAALGNDYDFGVARLRNDLIFRNGIEQMVD